MNKNIIILILLVIFSVTLVTCGNSEDNKTTTTTTITNDAATKDVTDVTDVTVSDVKTITRDVRVSDVKTIEVLSPIAKDKEIVIAFADAFREFEARNQSTAVAIDATGIEEVEKKYQTEFKKVVDICLDEKNELSKSEECHIIIEYSQR